MDAGISVALRSFGLLDVLSISPPGPRHFLVLRADVALYVPHQANLRIVDAAAEKLGLDATRVIRNITRYANTTAATIPIGLSEAYQQKKIHGGDIVLLATFGAGFTSGSLLLRWSLD